ncbi:MAG: peptidylprolyl isomerase [Bacteroidales bacterium]|jgi:cyclophilin family peptidyl-prolyl cis-trans isomerase|nr:peptidylprolyl isomerase [Bacteroidales bacterium]MDD4500565.1 peptidylprolyl isomerase [Bacteroidales bacterium]
MRTVITIIIVCFIFVFSACDKEIEKGVMKSDLSKDVELITDYGTIILRLSDETPKHRNNFIKLVNQKAYDGVSFHRVINNFLIQTGDMGPDTSGLSYMIDAEFRPNLLHKRGAVNAARMGDDENPGRSSDGTQFTIIQGNTYNDSTLAIAEKRINTWLAYNKVINKPEHKSDLDKLDSLTNIELMTMDHYSFPEAHREIYKTLGGAAHLDQNYTVFGEVVKGMNIVDSIAGVETDSQDKPINDVRIISARMIKRKSY